MGSVMVVRPIAILPADIPSFRETRCISLQRDSEPSCWHNVSACKSSEAVIHGESLNWNDLGV